MVRDLALSSIRDGETTDADRGSPPRARGEGGGSSLRP
jgi:hypothetical protein